MVVKDEEEVKVTEVWPLKKQKRRATASEV